MCDASLMTSTFVEKKIFLQKNAQISFFHNFFRPVLPLSLFSSNYIIDSLIRHPSSLLSSLQPIFPLFFNLLLLTPCRLLYNTSLKWTAASFSLPPYLYFPLYPPLLSYHPSSYLPPFSASCSPKYPTSFILTHFYSTSVFKSSLTPTHSHISSPLTTALSSLLLIASLALLAYSRFFHKSPLLIFPSILKHYVSLSRIYDPSFIYSSLPYT